MVLNRKSGPGAMVTLGSGFMPLVGFGTYKVGAVPASASSAADGAPPPPSGPDVSINY